MRIRGKLVGGLAMAAICLPAGSALAAPGDLDPTFGNGGKATFAGTGAEEIGLQAGGRIVAVTSINVPGGSDFGLIRAGTNGALDPSFGTGGLAQLNIGGGDTGVALAIAPDQRIYAVGTATSPGGLRFAVARFSSQGQLDTSFAPPNGFLTSKYEILAGSSDDLGRAVTVLPDGNVLVGGQSNGANPARDDFAAARVTPGGILDSGFGGDGGTTIAVGNGTIDALASDVKAQPDGKIVLGGQAFSGGTFVARLTASGAPDTSFASGAGQRSVPAMTTGGSLALQPDGKIIVVGTDGADAVVARLLPNGTPDDSFSGDGRAPIDFGATDFATAVALQPDGKIVIAGSADSNPQGDYGVARLQPNGAPDTTFGNGGVARINITPGDLGNALALQPDGKIVVGGASGSSIEPPFDFVTSMARLQGDPPGNVAGKCRGKKATIVGTNAKDKLKGTKRKDVVSAGGGRDTVKGLKGNDLICGGKGPDKLIGGPGKDTLLGEKGKDKLFGGPKKDKLLGGAAKDLIVGGGGPDKINGGPGKDSEKQ